MAGSDTTGISLRAVFYYLIRNPESYKKLQKEIDELDDAGKLSPVISYAESLQMDYLYVDKASQASLTREEFLKK